MATRNKTHSGAKKRIKLTKAGNLLRRRPSGTHFLQKKSGSRKRGFGLNHSVDSSDATRVKKQLGV